MFETQLSEYCVDFHSVETNILQQTFSALAQDADLVRSKLEDLNARYCGALMLQYDRVLAR